MHNDNSMYSEFGFGGFGYGGFGNQGKYGGYRSSYDYRSPMRQLYPIAPQYTVISPTWHSPTFIFAAFILIVLILGLWIGGFRKDIYY